MRRLRAGSRCELRRKEPRRGPGIRRRGSDLEVVLRGDLDELRGARCHREGNAPRRLGHRDRAWTRRRGRRRAWTRHRGTRHAGAKKLLRM